MSSDSPLGIRQLERLSKILIRQNRTRISNNKYEVMSPDGSTVLFAKEDSGLLDRMLVGTSRAFEINIFDTEDKEVIRLRRPYTMGPDKMDVCVCGQPASVVRREVTFLKPVINVNDARDRPAYRVKGPLVTTSVCDFEIYTKDKKRIGVIGKKWSSGVKEMVSYADSYVIEVPQDLDVRYKAAFIGTCLLIDFMFYES
ncbi:phospholipid scramblase 2-like [Battus philenor]|uniref:phospholipid scramblase 2-like n=1 Tax=Battus philenor TaxID=42288 RepID=UPI0035CF6A16